ncbi:MAG: hypothetical protein J6T80_01260 [Paludibacteraceae bacterium]|nr:hypothetical protein [Paludibacteraceae bacterium]
MKKTILLCSFAALVLCSCSSIQTVSYSEYRTVEPTQSMHAIPLVADLQVSDTRMSYTEKVIIKDKKPSEQKIAGMIAEIKSTVLSHAIKYFNTEVMVAPIIDIQKEGTNALVVIVTGYPATYKNIRSATKDDSWFVTIGEPKEEAPAPDNKKFKLFGK